MTSYHLFLKENDLLELCNRWSLDDGAIERLSSLTRIKNVNVNCIDACNRTPLLLLCLKNRSKSLFRALEVLLNCDSVDINAKDRDGFNAISLVCLYEGSPMLAEIIKLLTRYGADIHATTNQGWTVIHALCNNFNGRVPMLLHVTETLLDAGADVRVKATDGSNALVALCSDYSHSLNSDFLAVLRLFIERKMDLNATDVCGRIGLRIICSEYKGVHLMEIVRLLVAGNIDVKPRMMLVSSPGRF